MEMDLNVLMLITLLGMLLAIFAAIIIVYIYASLIIDQFRKKK